MADNIIRIDLNGVNCYLLKGDSGFVLVDTGGHLVMDKQFTNRREILLQKLDAAGCTQYNLNLIVLTHGDYDHTCNAKYLRERYHAKIALHKGDLKLVETPVLHEWMNSFKFNSFAYKLIFRLLGKTITKVTQKTIEDFESFTPDIFLDDGFDLSAYGIDAKVIHLPGHTNGSIAILTKDGALISGDTFANNKKPLPAPNAIDFQQLSSSIQKLRNYAIGSVYPGHGEPFAFKEI